MTPQEYIDKVLELDAKVAKEPWDTWIIEKILAKADPGSIRESERKKNAALIAHYRTATPRLAKALRAAIEALNCYAGGLNGVPAENAQKQITAILGEDT